jgi:DNA-binding XRE family transcriptional regulator
MSEVVMEYRPQQFTAPDGTRLVVITEDHYHALLEAAEDADDLAAAASELMRMRVSDDGAIPAHVSRDIRSGKPPLAVWRSHRGLTQTALADASGVPQSAIARIEAGKGYGRPETRKALAAALDAPLWSLDRDNVV